MSESLHLTRNGSILEITLDRPKANAIDAKTSFEMGEVFLNFRDDPAITCRHYYRCRREILFRGLGFKSGSRRRSTGC